MPLPPLPARATLCEVGPRDGFQVEATFIPTDLKVEIIEGLAAAGLPEIQIASFVHPARVPQMADAEAVSAQVRRAPGVVYTGLALNERGVARAAAAGLDAVDVSISTNDAHSRRNAGASLDDARASMRAMIRRARAEGIEVRAGLQCVWSCGTDGPTPEDHAVAMAREVLDEGVDFLSLADSTGEADPVRVTRLLDRVLPLAGPVPLVLHLHDTRGMALPNIVAALQLGVTRFDTALGGMGGCPFIPGATGNVATEDTAHLLARMGVETGIDVASVAALTRRLEAFLGRPFSGRVYPLLAPPAA